MTVRFGRVHRLLAAGTLLLAVACTDGGGDGDGATLSPPTMAGRSATPRHWRLVFHDEFRGSKLDTGRWATCYDWNQNGCTNSGNAEAEWYLPGQVSVGGGALTLSADRRLTRGSDGREYPWASGMISTGRDSWDATPRRTFTYGYFEAAIKIPPQAGMFPAFWLMPASRYTPPELDIMEFYRTTRRVLMNVHWRDSEGLPRQAKGKYGPVDFPARYHVFGLLWKPDELTWFVDGAERYRVTGAERVPHVPMEVLVDLAVGVPRRPPPSVNSAQMKVDWVRVWQQ
ncbi:family 16 glycosylhydrolase [Streptomyces canus]|uniref:glycoside hydrolase family 16 protein n=1 Tax=Streptomyces canus TaxID=58343 RepID=UPI0036E135D6